MHKYVSLLDIKVKVILQNGGVLKSNPIANSSSIESDFDMS
jgi:hypothetical protein